MLNRELGRRAMEFGRAQPFLCNELGPFQAISGNFQAILGNVLGSFSGDFKQFQAILRQFQTNSGNLKNSLN